MTGSSTTRTPSRSTKGRTSRRSCTSSTSPATTTPTGSSTSLRTRWIRQSPISSIGPPDRRHVVDARRRWRDVLDHLELRHCLVPLRRERRFRLALVALSFAFFRPFFSVERPHDCFLPFHCHPCIFQAICQEWHMVAAASNYTYAWS